MVEMYIKQLAALENGWGRDTKQDLIKCLNEVKLRLCIIAEEEPSPSGLC